jgi:hypothetical protein
MLFISFTTRTDAITEYKDSDEISILIKFIGWVVNETANILKNIFIFVDAPEIFFCFILSR